MTTTTVDLVLTKEIVSGALDGIESLNGKPITDDCTLGNKPAAAQLNRELLNLADQLQLAAALVRNEYWTGKGLLSYAV